MTVGLLISGRGSNMQAIIDAVGGGDFPARVGVVISNVADAVGLRVAAARGIPTRVIDHRRFPTRAAFEEALDHALRDAGVGLVCLCGFMRLLTEHFVRLWWDKLVNIHPSLLPAFRGLHVHEAVLSSGVRFTGCTVHFVRPAMDNGPIIIQAAVPVHPDDDPQRLAERVLREEHKIYPQAIRMIAEGRAVVINEVVRLADVHPPADALINPPID